MDVTKILSAVVENEKKSPHEEEWESFRAIAGHFINLEVKGVWISRGHAPGNFCTDLLLRTVDHIKLFVILDAHYKLVGLVLDAARYISLSEISLR